MCKTTGQAGNSIPPEWNYCLLGELAEKPQYGLTASANTKPVGPRFLRITDIQDGGVSWPSVPYCECGGKEAEKYRLRQGDLVIARIGATTGKAYLISESTDAVFASYLIRLRTTQNLLPEFFYFFTQSTFYWEQIDAVKGGRLKQGVNIPVLRNLTIPLPPLAEQRAIAHVLRTVQQAKEATEKVIEAAKQLKKSLMQHLFTYGSVTFGEAGHIEQEDGLVGPMPFNWFTVKLSEVADIVYGVQAAVAHLEDESKGIPILTNVNITVDGALDLGLLRYYELPPQKRKKLILQKGDILFNWRSGSQHHVGKTAVFDVDGEYTFSSFILRFRVTESVNNKFLYYYLAYLRNRSYFINFRSQSSVNSVFNASAAAQLEVKMPELQQQEQIAEHLSFVDAKIVSESKKRNALKAIFDSLMIELMTGQIRVHELDLPELKESS